MISDNIQLQKEKKFIVCDAGGGTVVRGSEFLNAFELVMLIHDTGHYHLSCQTDESIAF